MVEPIDASRSEPLSAPKPRRASSWNRLSLRSGFVLITLSAILLGFKYEQLPQRKRAAHA